MRTKRLVTIFIFVITAGAFFSLPAFAWQDTTSQKLKGMENQMHKKKEHRTPFIPTPVPTIIILQPPAKQSAPITNNNVNQNNNTQNVVQNANPNIVVNNENNPNFSNNNAIAINNNSLPFIPPPPPAVFAPAIAYAPPIVAPAVQPLQLPQTGPSLPVTSMLFGLLPLGVFLRKISYTP